MRISVTTLLLATLLAGPLEAQLPPADNGTAQTSIGDGVSGPVPPAVVTRDSTGRPTVRAVRLSEGLVVDGRLDEPVIGLMATNRSVALDGIGGNQAYGVDANFSFLQNLNISSYYAGTSTAGRSDDDTSYMARIGNEGDRYGFSYQHLMVGKNFNPEVGFVRRDDFRKNRAEVKFKPRPSSIQAIRQFELQASIENLSSLSTGTLETRQLRVGSRSGSRTPIGSTSMSATRTSSWQSRSTSPTRSRCRSGGTTSVTSEPPTTLAHSDECRDASRSAPADSSAVTGRKRATRDGSR